MTFRPATLTAAIVLSFLCAAGSGFAQSDQSSASKNDGDALLQTLRSMQEELDRLRQSNEAMKGEIDELRARTDDNWLTEERATQIRGLVEDVLADADTRATMLNDGVMAGWSEHFFLADAFGRFLLQIEGMVQARFVYNYTDQVDRSRFGFDVPRTRLTFRGHLYDENLQYLVRGEWDPIPASGIAAGAFGLLDAWTRYNFSNEWSVRVGQFKLPFLREELVSESEQLAVERSLVAHATSIGRSLGIELSYHDSANAFSLAFSNGLTNPMPLLLNLMGGPNVNRPAIGANVEYAITARYERLLAGSWNQFQDFTSPMGDEYGMLFGIAVHAQNNEASQAQIIGESEPRSMSATADLSIEWGGANAFVSATYHYIDHPSNQILHMIGIVGHVGVYVAPKWEVFARAEWIQMENVSGGGIATPDLGVGTLGVNYYIEGHDIKWTTDVGFAVTRVSPFFTTELAGWRGGINGDVIPEVVLRTQLQIVF